MPRFPSSAAALIFLFSASIVRSAPVEILPTDVQDAVQPQVSIAPSGRIHVTFGKGATIYHASSVDRARTFSRPVIVGQLSKLALGMRRGPRVVASEQGTVVTAISHADGDLHSWFSSDDGGTWKQNPRITEIAKCAREGLHAMAGDGRGNVLVTWLDLRNGGMELWRAISADGGASWSGNAQVYCSPDGHICECCHPSAAMDADGRAAVMWRNWLGGSRDMYAALSSDCGRTFAPAQKLGSGTWKLNGCPMDGGAIAFGSAGQLLTVWRREKTVFASESISSERPLTGDGLQPIVVTAGRSGPLELWQDAHGVVLRKGSAAPIRFAENGSFAAAAALPRGGAVIVWESQANGRKTLLAEMIE